MLSVTRQKAVEFGQTLRFRSHRRRLFYVRKLDACNGPHELDSFGVLRDLPSQVHPVATMQTKSVNTTPTHSHQNSSDTTLPYRESAHDSSARIVAHLSAHCSTLQERQARLAALLNESDAAAPSPSLSFLDQQLVESARLVAQVLELAERANEKARTSSTGLRGKPSMRALADACFDAILRIDAALHNLGDSTEAGTLHRRKQTREGLRRAQKALTKVEQQLRARTLQLMCTPGTAGAPGHHQRCRHSTGPSDHLGDGLGRRAVRVCGHHGG